MAGALLFLLISSSVVVGQTTAPTTTPAPVATPTPVATPIGSPAAGTPGPTVTPSGEATPYIPGPGQSPCPLPNPLPTPHPTATPYPHPLCPAVPADPAGTLAWLFNPIFQTMFLVLTLLYTVFGDIGIAIILLTLLIKTLLIPLFRQQIVSQRRMQMLQPEIRALNAKYKGNRTKISEETMKLYRERGVNPAAGCLPTVLQLFLLLPIYQVISQGLGATDISSAMQFLGFHVFNPTCLHPGTLAPCLDPTIHWLGNLDAHVSEVLFRLPASIPFAGGFGISLLALVSAFLQLIQTRMMTPQTNDPQQAANQRILLFLPLISIVYGSFLPAGLFIYWIVFTAYSIVQQYLIVGWGSLFPLFGWTPGFAQDHSPRYPVAMPAPIAKKGDDDADNTGPRSSPNDRAAGTFRPAPKRGRTSRRGRRR